MRKFTAIALVLALAGCGEDKAPAQVVDLYSSQQEHLIRPILDDFTKESGIQVNLISGKDAELLTRLEYEGKNSPADAFFAVDIGNLEQAKAKGILQSVSSKVLEQNIPAPLRDKDGYWYAMTTRARVIVYNKAKVDGNSLQHYMDVTKPEFKGRFIVTSSSSRYNQSLMAYMIAHFGEEKALEWAKGVVANMARAPQGKDTDQVLAVMAGEADVAIVNSYYLGRLLAGKGTVSADEVKEKIGVVFPEQDTVGTHANVRGGGVTASAQNKEGAVKLLEFLSTPEAQKFFAENNMEFPAHKDVAAAKEVAPWQAFKFDSAAFAEIAAYQTKAVQFLDEAGWR